MAPLPPFPRFFPWGWGFGSGGGFPIFSQLLPPPHRSVSPSANTTSGALDLGVGAVAALLCLAVGGFTL